MLFIPIHKGGSTVLESEVTHRVPKGKTQDSRAGYLAANSSQWVARQYTAFLGTVSVVLCCVCVCVCMLLSRRIEYRTISPYTFV